MRRYRTRTTAWPAVADLMTALAVFGLACTFFVASQNSGMEARIESLETRIESLKAQPEGPSRLGKSHSIFCWSRDDPVVRHNYYVIYDVEVQDGRFSFVAHEDWGPGTEFRERIPPSLMDILLENLPRDATEKQVTDFSDRVFRAIDDRDYPDNCKLAVTVNREANGRHISILTKNGFDPYFRDQ